MIIDGKKIAEKELVRIKNLIKKNDLKLNLTVISTGENPASGSFIKQKKKAAETAGVGFKIKNIEPASTNKLRKEIVKISKVKSVDGVIIQLPLPDNINEQYILDTIPAEKDVDFVSKKSWGSFITGRSKGLPPSVLAFDLIMKEAGVNYKKSSIAVVGYGRLIGRPIAHWSAMQGSAVSIVNEHTKNPEYFMKKADIIVSGAGSPGLIKKDMVKEGVIACDFGFSMIDGNIRGDFDPSVADVAKIFTPVPGGIGPILTASILKNLITLSTG